MSTSNSNQSIPPFPPFPSVARLVDLGSTKDAIARVSRAVRSGESLALVIGPPGVGKSLVCNALAQQFSDSHDVVMLGEIPITDAASYYRAVLHHLGVDYQSIPAGDLYVSLVDRITGKAMTKDGLLIVVDEAQLLSADVLDAIRTTTNIMKEQQPYVSAVVCGGVKLEDTLAIASMEPFTQRVATRCYIHPMNATETRQYISESIRACGSDPNATMTDEAMGAVHHACNGVPRLINQMMTEAIDFAADAEQTMIDESVIDGAWAMLQQLPSPMVQEQKIVHKSTPVEFAALSDWDEMPAAPAPIETPEFQAIDRIESIEQSHANDTDVCASSSTTDEEEKVDCEDTSNEAMLAMAAAGPAADDAAKIDHENETVTQQERAVSIDESAESRYESTTNPQAGPSCDASETSRMVANEPTIVSVQMTPATSQLFGEFEAEESLDVQGMFQASRQVNMRISSQASETTRQETVQTESTQSSDEQPALQETHIEEIRTEETAVQATPAQQAPVQPTPVQPVAASASLTNECESREDEVCEREIRDEMPMDQHGPPDEIRHSQSIDFEASIHDEVLLLNEMATQARFGGIDPENTFSAPEQNVVSTHEQPPIWLVEEEVVQPETPLYPMVNNLRQYDQRPLPSPAPTAEELCDMEVISDDSDLLIIEDELDVVPRPHVAMSAQPETTVSVDFQAMLTKMRSGN